MLGRAKRRQSPLVKAVVELDQALASLAVCYGQRKDVRASRGVTSHQFAIVIAESPPAPPHR